MIALKNRFHGHNSVTKVRGSSVGSDGFKVFCARNHKRTDYRMAVIVSKKVAKSAVVRNRIRRRLYESVRVSGHLSSSPVDAVFLVQDAKLATIPHVQLVAQVDKACAKILSLCR